MRRLSKRAQGGLTATTPKETVKTLGTQVKGLLDSLTPMMQGLQQTIPQLNSTMQIIQQLEQQVISMEQARSNIQKAVQTTQPADDVSFKDLVKDLSGKGWAKITEMLDSDDHKEYVGDNAVAGVRGEAPLPGVVKEAKDLIPGGKGDKTPEKNVNKKQLDMGEKVEMEHTNDPNKAREIAKDHLSEQLDEGMDKDEHDYYTELKKIHEDKCIDSIPSFWRNNLDYGSK